MSRAHSRRAYRGNWGGPLLGGGFGFSSSLYRNAVRGRAEVFHTPTKVRVKAVILVFKVEY
jgi:hypothetical protein